MNTLTEVRARLDAVTAELRQIAAEEIGPEADTDEARAAFDAHADALLDERTALLAREARMVKIVEAAEAAPTSTRSADATRRPVVPGELPDPFDLRGIDVLGRDPRLVGREIHGRARTAIERSSATDEAKAEATRKLERFDTASGALARHILVTGNPAYERAFGKLISGETWDLDNEERAAVHAARAASLSGSAGGYAIPFTLDPTVIWTGAGAANPFRMISNVQTIVTDQWNGVSSAGITASWDGEAAEVSDDTPTLAQPSIDVKKAQAFVPFSIEVGEDWAGMQGEMVRHFGFAKDTLEEAAFATGAASSNNPVGIVTGLVAGSATVTETTDDAFAIADVYKVFAALAPRFRSNGAHSWIMNVAILNLIRQFATANNYHGFTVDLTSEGVPQLLGGKVYESTTMDSTVTASGAVNNYIAVVGNIRECFTIVDRVGMSVELIPHLFATANNLPSGSRGLYAYWRVGSAVTNATAAKVLNIRSAA
jgi:HK97 family phage major capsid protein